MRIGLIYLGRHGAGGAISLQIAAQLAKQHEVCAVISAAGDTRPDWNALPLQVIETSTFQSLLQAAWSLIIQQVPNRLAARLSAFQPDVLIFPMFHPWNVLLQKRLRSTPALVFVHDPQPHPDLAGWFYERIENESIRRAARCVLMSASLKPFLVERGAAQVDVLPLGPLAYPVASPAPRPPNASARLLFFGRIAPYKGLEIILQAYQRARLAHPCSLAIVGSGSLRPYRALLATLPDVEIVNRWIPEDKIGAHFAASDLVILPYTSASQSGVIPIAATFGLPVIASRIGGLPEQIEDGRSGWLVEPGNPQALTQAILQALEDPAEARLRGRALQQRYQQDFSWENFSVHLNHLLQDIVTSA